jgi:malate permease and related proteins
MSSLGIHLFQLYTPLVGWTFVGWLLSCILPKSTPIHLGRFLFWVGIPVSIVAFLRRTDLSSSVWVAPIVAWVAILMGAGLAWFLLKSPLRFLSGQQGWGQPTQGSFLLAAMVGNTGYIGYPVTLTLVGQKYFAWALFYDLLGTTLGAYGLGVVLAARFGAVEHSHGDLLQTVAKNPALWSFGLGLLARDLTLLPIVEQSLQRLAWSAIALALVLIGMRLQQLSTWQHLAAASISLSIKMLIVPLLLGMGLLACGLNGPPLVVLVLQMAMPPAFATLVLAEVYKLDHNLTVTALALGSIGLLITLPIWLWLFNGY